MAESWVRLWAGMTTDSKVRTIARKSGRPVVEVVGLFAHLMLIANESECRGDLDGLIVEDVASALDMDEEVVQAILDTMQGRVIEDGRLSGWDRRQPVREDGGNDKTGAKSAADRKREQRAREAAEREAMSRDVTHGHAMSRDVTHGHAMSRTVTHCHAPEAEADTEADIPPPPPARDGDFPMGLDWQPSEHFPTLARQAGVPADQITAEALAEFRSYWIGQGKAHTQHQWDHKLLTNLKAQRARSQSPPSRASPGRRQPQTLSEGRAAAAKAIFNPGPIGADDGHDRTIDVTPTLADGVGAKALR